MASAASHARHWRLKAIAEQVSLMKAASISLDIGVPVFNGERFLQRTVESLLAQTFDAFEMVISDNASTDGTEKIARDLMAADPRVAYHRQPRNLGLAANYSFLARRASAPYFTWANCDDIYDPRFLERCIEVLERDAGVVLAYARTRFIDEEDRPLSEVEDPGFPLDFEPPSARLWYVIEAGHWNNALMGVIRTRALEATRLWPNYPGGDYVLLGELCTRGRFVEIPEPLFRRRIHAEASSQLVKDPEPERILRYVTGRVGFTLPTWYRFRDHLRTILVSEIGVREKLSLVRLLLRLARWQRDRLRGDLGFAARAMIQRVRRLL
jgi:glycosyltransferase involved in cell wall biosynthesis